MRESSGHRYWRWQKLSFKFFSVSWKFCIDGYWITGSLVWSGQIYCLILLCLPFCVKTYVFHLSGESSSVVWFDSQEYCHIDLHYCFVIFVRCMCNPLIKLILFHSENYMSILSYGYGYQLGIRLKPTLKVLVKF